jgi:hypothetical protein
MRKLIAGAAGAAVAVAGLVALAGPAAAETASTAIITKPTTGYLWPTNSDRRLMVSAAGG